MWLRRSLLPALLLAQALLAQDEIPAVEPDLRDTPWQEDEVGVGVVLRHHRFDELFGAPQSVTVLLVERPDRERYLRVAAPDPVARVKTSDLASKAGALAAVNGGFFDTSNGAPIGLLKQDGEVVSPGNGEMHVAIAIDRRERTSIEEVVASETLSKAEHALAARPILLRSGDPIHPHGWGGNDRRHPRTAVGLTKKGDLVFVTVDGRTDRSAGMTLLELARLMQALDCDVAMNLDGGGSSTMWVEGDGIVNHPCDNKQFDHAGERGVANAVLIHAPSIVRLDEEAAELEPKDAWQIDADDERAIGGDCAEGTGPDAVARFELVARRAGKFDLQFHAPSRRGASSALTFALDGREHRVSMPSAGKWDEVVEELDLERGATLVVEVRAADDRPLRIDALRLVEQR